MKCALQHFDAQLSAVRFRAVQYAVCLMSLVLQVWLPIRLIQNRVENEIKNNLAAVRQHSEALHGRRGSKEGARRI